MPPKSRTSKARLKPEAKTRVAWLSAKELAAHWGMNEDSVYRWRERGFIPPEFVRRQGLGRILFAPETVEHMGGLFERVRALSPLPQEAQFAAGTKRSKMPQNDLGRPEVADSPSDAPNPLRCAAPATPVSGQNLHSGFSHHNTCDRLRCAELGGIPQRLVSLGKLDDRACLKPTDAAALLDTCSEHIHSLVEEGKLRAIDVAGRNQTARRCLRIPVESITALLKECEVIA